MLFCKEWWKAAITRAVKTFAQAFASGITVGVAFYEIDWRYIASCADVAAVYSMITSLAGLPEVPKECDKHKEEN